MLHFIARKTLQHGPARPNMVEYVSQFFSNVQCVPARSITLWKYLHLKYPLKVGGERERGRERERERETAFKRVVLDRVDGDRNNRG